MNIVKIPPVIAETVVLCYNNMQSSLECARSIMGDPQSPNSLKTEMTAIAVSLSNTISRFEKRIPQQSWQQFSLEVKEADPHTLDNIKSLFTRMTPHQREMLELCAEGIKKGEIIFQQS